MKRSNFLPNRLRSFLIMNISKGFKITILFFLTIGCFVAVQTASATEVKIPAQYSRFKDLLNKNLNISLNESNKNYLRYLDGGVGSVPLKNTNFSTVNGAGSQFIREYGKQFGILNVASDLKLQNTNRDVQGQNYLFYNQFYKGIPVYGGEMIVRVGDDLKVQSGLGKIMPSISLDVKPKIVKSKAEQLALKVLNINNGSVSAASELVIYNPQVFDSSAKSKNTLAWSVVLENGADGQNIFIDAKTGKLITSLPLEHNLTASIDSSASPDFQVLRSLTGKDTITRVVYNCGASGCTAASTPDETVFTIPASKRAEGDAAIGVAEADNAYDLLNSAFAYYKDTFDLWGANGFGGMGKNGNADFPLLNTTVFTDFIPVNSSSTCPNSWGGALDLLFCNNTANTVTVGHEYQHAVSAFNKPSTNGFIYRRESGAIEEAYADIFGQALDRRVNGFSSWKLSFGGNVVRNIADPENLNKIVSGTDCPCPKTHYSPKFYCGAWDNGAVHRNSTVVTHMAYLLKDGGALNGCAFGGIGQETVEKIFFHAFRNNLPSAPTFMDLYTGLRNSCFTLYGLSSSECRNLVLAMQAVELDQPGKCVTTVKEKKPACTYDVVDPGGLLEFGKTKVNLKLLAPAKVDVITSPGNIPTIPVVPTVPPVQVPDVISTPVQPSNPSEPAVTSNPDTSVPVAPAEPEVRQPSFSIDLTNDGGKYMITGQIDYYGKGASCSGPRPFDPVVIRWGDGGNEPIVAGNTFSANHSYNVKQKYTITVSVYNSCYGMTSHTKDVIN